jgi:hypothetical protein
MHEADNLIDETEADTIDTDDDDDDDEVMVVYEITQQMMINEDEEEVDMFILVQQTLY